MGYLCFSGAPTGWSRSTAESWAVVPLAAAQRLTGGRVPDVRGVVLGDGQHAPAVGAELRGHDAAGVPQRRRQRPAGFDLPDARHLVGSGGDDALTVRAERGVLHGG